MNGFLALLPQINHPLILGLKRKKKIHFKELFQGDIKVKYFAFSDFFIDGKSLQNFLIGFGSTAAVFMTKPNNFPEAVISRVGRYITARAQKSRTKTWRCKPILSAAFVSSHFKALGTLLLKVTHMPGPVKDAVKAQ